MDLTRPHVQALTIDYQTVMIPFNRFVESIVVNRPLLCKRGGHGRGQHEARDPHRYEVTE
jgi:hypothetical protein